MSNMAKKEKDLVETLKKRRQAFVDERADFVSQVNGRLGQLNGQVEELDRMIAVLTGEDEVESLLETRNGQEQDGGEQPAEQPGLNDAIPEEDA